jgi:small subunit ribosomal protein S30e
VEEFRFTILVQLLTIRINYQCNSSSKSTGKVHGSLARAGKVKGQTPKAEKVEKSKKPKGRAFKRLLYNRRYVNVVVGKKHSHNSLAAQNEAKGIAPPQA